MLAAIVNSLDHDHLYIIYNPWRKRYCFVLTELLVSTKGLIMVLLLEFGWVTVFIFWHNFWLTSIQYGNVKKLLIG